MKDLRASILTVPSFGRMHWLVHGFGTGAWREENFAASPAFSRFTPVIMRQLHSDIVHRLGSAPERKLEGDALITNVPGLLLVVRTADCLPVLLVDECHRAVGSVHCGWRGTRARILERAIEAMHDAYGTDSASLLAALGPCIGPCCYEVGPEIKESFADAGFPASVFHDQAHGAAAAKPRAARNVSSPKSGRSSESAPKAAAPPVARRKDDKSPEKPEPVHAPVPTGRAFLDLRAANAWLLGSLGVPEANITGPQACTSCDSGLLSYRRHPGEKRRMYNFVGIRQT